MVQKRKRIQLPRGQGTVAPRGDGWVAAAFIDTPTGRKRVYRYADTAEGAVAKLDTARDLARQHVRTDKSRLTVGDYLEGWLVQKREHVRPGGFRYYEQNTRLYLLPSIGQRRLQLLDVGDVRSMLGRMEQDGLSPRTRAMAHATLRSALNDALREGLVSRNVASLVRPPRADREPVTAPAPDQVRRLLRAAEGDRLSAAYVVAAHTGLRQGELLGLRWSDVEVGLLRVRGTLARRGKAYLLDAPKTDRSRRDVPMDGAVLDALHAHKQRQDAERAKCRRWNDNGLVFTTTNGSPVNGTWLTHRLQHYCEVAGIPQMRWHDLRHFWATASLAAGVPAHVVQQLGGWTSYAVLMSTYAHVIPSQAEDAAERVGRILSGE